MWLQPPSFSMVTWHFGHSCCESKDFYKSLFMVKCVFRLMEQFLQVFHQSRAMSKTVWRPAGLGPLFDCHSNKWAVKLVPILVNIFTSECTVLQFFTFSTCYFLVWSVFPQFKFICDHYINYLQTLTRQEGKTSRLLCFHTLVFAAIQLEVSLSSSHFLIHFLNHYKRIQIWIRNNHTMNANLDRTSLKILKE